MKRREFITLLGGRVAARGAGAAGGDAHNGISGSPQEDTQPLVAFRQGLKEVGYIEG